MKWCPPFATQGNFFDRQFTKDGKPYAPFRYKEIVKELFIISREINTSYTDLLSITPREKNYMLEFIRERVEREKEAIEKARMERELNKKTRR